MGLSADEQRKAQELRQQLNGKPEEKTAEESVQVTDSITNGTVSAAFSCCQGRGNMSCCQNETAEDKLESNNTNGQETENIVGEKSSKDSKSKTRKVCGIPTWFESWEREDTYAALAVVAAVASVAVAYGYYRQLK